MTTAETRGDTDHTIDHTDDDQDEEDDRNGPAVEHSPPSEPRPR